MPAMDDSSYFFKLLAFFACAALVVVLALNYLNRSRPAVAQAQSTYSPAPLPAPQKLKQTIAFMPGQYLDVPNRRFRKVEIHSTFPIRVVSGACQQNYGVEFYCDGNPTDIFITDMRSRPIFSTPQANTITLTAVEY